MNTQQKHIHSNLTAETEPSDHSRETSLKIATWVRRLSMAVILLGLLVLIRTLPTEAVIQTAIGWVEQLGALAPFAFVGAYLLVTVFMLPAWPLSMAAGMLFGLVPGTLAVVTGATLGMATTFLIGRYAARSAVERKFKQYPRFAAIDRAVGEGGWKIVALLRLSPAVPFNLQNYLYGLTAIRFWPCVVASAFAIVPGTFMYVYFGYAGRASIGAVNVAQSERGAGEWILLFVGLVATITLSIYITKIARKALQEQTRMEDENTAPKVEPETLHATDRNPWMGTGKAMLAAAVVTLVVGYSQFGSALLVGIFGPPAVSMNEAYAPKEDGSRFDHAPFDALLKKHVNENGGVDYAGMMADQGILRAYIATLAEAPFEELGRNEKLALLINAYNAFTLELIVEWLDKNIESIRDIPAAERWDDERWNIGGNILSLSQIEHEQIRPNFREPNVHWALVCAAVGCPPLRAEAYAATRIEEQLKEQARVVHTNGSRWLHIGTESDTVHLTALYNWYGGDFEQVAGSVLDYAAKYSPELAQTMKSGLRPSIRWLNYDWSLNNQDNLN